jgi:CDGSH-type Zn-finger protein
MDAEIAPTPNGPLHAQRIRALKNDRGETIDSGESIYLCRCGASKNKPYCDGSHAAVAFSDRRIHDKPPPPAEFAGKEITIVDDFSLCAHAGACVEGAPDTFFAFKDGRRVSLPDATPSDQVMATIRRCPSGSLLYKVRGTLTDAYAAETEVQVERDGPYLVRRAKLAGDARPATEDHYTLCRCGASQNKPFCDGMHTKVKFRDGSTA